MFCTIHADYGETTLVKVCPNTITINKYIQHVAVVTFMLVSSVINPRSTQCKNIGEGAPFLF